MKFEILFSKPKQTSVTIYGVLNDPDNTNKSGHLNTKITITLVLKSNNNFI